MNIADLFADLYEWLDNAYNAAMMLNQPQLAMQYITQMRAMEIAGVVVAQKKETVH